MELIGNTTKRRVKIIASGGGTAGHIYPALAVLDRIESELGKENCEVLFIGVEGKMECRIVPQHGYKITTLKVSGLVRSFSFKNIKTTFNLLFSLIKVIKIMRDFKPDIVIGFGGYVSAPVIFAASRFNNLRYIWEGNSFAGLANRATGKYCNAIFASFPTLSRFFPDKEIIISGSPIRGDFSNLKRKNSEALSRFNFCKDQKIIFITGGSLGARQMNEAVLAHIERLTRDKSIGVIWQTGRLYYEEMVERTSAFDCSNIWMGAFIDSMAAAYAISDVVVCRSGSSTVAEVACCGIATLFVPSSGVTDDHQTKNAQSIVDSGAATMVSDSESIEKMIPMAISLLGDDEKRAEMGRKIVEFAHKDAATIIVNKILSDVGKS